MNTITENQVCTMLQDMTSLPWHVVKQKGVKDGFHCIRLTTVTEMCYVDSEIESNPLDWPELLKSRCAASLLDVMKLLARSVQECGGDVEVTIGTKRK